MAGKKRVHTTKTPGLYRVDPSRIFKEGAWEVRYRDPDGATRRKTFKTKQEALDFQAAVRTDKRRGEFIDPGKAKTPFRKVAESWYASTADLKPKTRQGYRQTLDRHLLPALGPKPIGRITPSVLRHFLGELPANLSPTTRRNIFRMLTPIFNMAIEDGMLSSNPTTRIKLPKPSRPEMPVLTAEQVRGLGEAIHPYYRTLIYFAAYTGMRSGEIAALRVKNLDLLRGRVHVEASLSDLWGSNGFKGRHFGPPKNGKRRSFAIPRFLVDMVSEHLAARPHNAHDFVFAGVKGDALRMGNFYTRHFKPAVRRALPEHLHGFRLHDLRHTCAALLIQQGTHPKAIQERLGHSSITVTMDVYGHLFEDHEEPIIVGLEETFVAAQAASGADVIGLPERPGC